MITLLPVTEGSKKAVDYCLFAGRTRFYWNEEEHPNAGVCCYQTNFTSHNQNIRGKAIHTQLGKTKGYKEKDGLKWDSPPRNSELQLKTDLHLDTVTPQLPGCSL
jgi:hypothetical protein